MEPISPIIPGAMANAGTSSRIAPRKGGFFQKLGAGIESFVNTAAPMISPEVREFENFRMSQEESRVNQGLVEAQTEKTRGEEERTRQEFERDNRFIDFDTALSSTTPGVRKFLEKEAEERLLTETDPETGKRGVRFGAGAKFLEEFQKDINGVTTINRLAIQDHSIDLSRIQKNIEKETSRMVKEIQSLDPSIGEMRAMEIVRANMQNPANQSEELRRAFDDKKFINEKINALIIENESMFSKNPSDLQEKINKLTPIVGEEEAIKIATGLIVTSTNPITKETERFDLSEVNKAINTSSISDNQKAELKSLSDKASGMTLWEASNLSTGIRSGARDAYNKLSSLTGLPPALATEAARTQLQTAGIALTTAMSNNSRYPEGLRKWILQQTDIQPSIFNSPKLLRQNFITLDTVLKNKILSEEQDRQLGILSPGEAIESNILLREMNNFRKMMGVPSNVTPNADGIQGLDVPPDIEDILNQSLGKKSEE